MPRVAAQVAAGSCVFVTAVAPAVAMWFAGREGSIGDLSELELLSTGVVVALCGAVVAGVLMGRALDIAEHDPRIGRLDPWAAVFVATAVLGSVVAIVPASTLLLLLPDEDARIGPKVHWIAGVWVAGAIVASAASIVAARAVLLRSAGRGAAPLAEGVEERENGRRTQDRPDQPARS